jgi:anti-anti-sigma regulatory factor
MDGSVREDDGSAPEDASNDASLAIAVFLRGEREAMITVGGKLDGTAVQRLALLLKAVLAVGAENLVVDLSEVTECDAAARPIFLKLQRSLQLKHGWMVLLDPPANLADLDPISLEAAFAAYRKISASTAGGERPSPASPDDAPVVA